MNRCSCSGCDKEIIAKGLCRFHYQRMRAGVPLDAPFYTKRGEQNPRWKGGKSNARKDGRVMVYCPDHPNAINGRYILRYRLVMERHLGRILDPSEIVHHINANPSDDRIENLVVTTRSSHSSLHRLGGPEGWSKKYARCITCGTTSKRHCSKGRCTACTEKACRKRRGRHE